MNSASYSQGFFGPRRGIDFGAWMASKHRRPRLRLPSRLRAHRRRTLKRAVAKRSRAMARDLEQRLLQRLSFGWNVADQEQIEAIGAEAWIEQQLHPEQIDDFGLEDFLTEALPTLSMSAAEIFESYEDNEYVPIFELWLATTLRVIYSPRQLYERMAMFWSDHFSIDIEGDIQHALKLVDDRQVIRPNALGSFPELLSASAHSPAMLVYLTNDSNIVGHPNENYARELMELHTMGVDGGYTQEDVREVARCLTGWTLQFDDEAPDFGGFHFEPFFHDFGAKRVLGTSIAAGGGESDGQRVLELLTEHPSTARFLARKLLVWVWGYQPTEQMVDDIVQVYSDTGGDIKAMLRAGAKWWRMARATKKLKRPMHLMASAIRALFGEVEEPEFVLDSLYQAGHLPFHWAPPNGYPDSEGYWSGFVVPRFNFAAGFVGDSDGPVVTDLDFLDPSMPATEMVELLDYLLLGGTMGTQTKATLTAFLESQPATEATVREAIGLTVTSPEFQSY